MVDVTRILSNLESGDPEVRARVARALAGAKGGQVQVVTTSLKQLARDPDPDVRVAAIESIGRLALAEGSREALEGLRDYENVDVRFTAAQALGSIGDPSTTRGLVEALSDPDGRVRKYAAESIGKIGAAARDAVPSLVRAYEGGSLDLKETVVRALGQVGGADAVQKLASWLDSEDSALAREALSALGRTGEPEALNAILGYAEGNPAAKGKLLRQAVARSLKELLASAKARFEETRARVEAALKKVK
ncbi:MAG: HEAT repeat domain-containing protein [Promethearchaeota archaeon]